MKATLLLADSAQADQAGKVHALGVGWTVTGAPTPPIGIITLIDVPWDQCNKQHTMKIELVDADGHMVAIGTQPDGTEMTLTVEAQFEAGRPPGAPVGSPVRLPMAINLNAGIPLSPGHSYEFRMEINGKHEEDWSAAFFVRPSGNPEMFGFPPG